LRRSVMVGSAVGPSTDRFVGAHPRPNMFAVTVLGRGTVFGPAHGPLADSPWRLTGDCRDFTTYVLVT
jgi:hypothetical protein